MNNKQKNALAGGYKIDVPGFDYYFDRRARLAVRRIVKRRAIAARCIDETGGLCVDTHAAAKRAGGVGVYAGAPLAKRDVRTLVAAGIPPRLAKTATWVSRW